MQNFPARARVTSALADAARFPVMLLAAPAGFGKTVALREFLSSTRLETITLNVQREHGTLLAFVRALSEALVPAAPNALAAFPSLQERILAAQQPVRELSDWFFAHVKDVSATIVIDDLHFAAADTATIALLADVIERTSDRIRWILAARSDVGLPVATWIAYGRMDLPIGEDTLRLTADEAAALNATAERPIDAHEVETLRRITNGWPLALHIALRTRTRAKDLTSATSGTRDLVYRYLAEQIFIGLSQTQREFLLSTSIFPTFDAEIAQTYGADAQFLTELKRDVTFIAELPQHNYRYHDLFRDFLEIELRRAGAQRWQQALRTGAQLLRQRGDDAAALRLLAKAGDGEAIVAIIEKNGIALFERGEGESLRVAIDALSNDAQRRNAATLGVHAMLEAARGHFDIAEPAFTAAIEGAQDLTLRLNLVHRYAVELVRQGRDCIALLEPYARDDKLPVQRRLPILGTLATAYASHEAQPKALQTIERALNLTSPETPDEILARLYQQASYVYQFPDPARARKFATRAVEVALANSLYDVAARACTILFGILYNETSDLAEMLAILDRLGEYARKGGSEQTRLYGVMASYDLEVERGEESTLDSLDEELAQSHASLPGAFSTLMLSPARALRQMWYGNFAEAAELLRNAASQTENPAARAVNYAQLTLCAFAAGQTAEGESALSETLASLGHAPATGMQPIRARLFLALAELSRGRSHDAHRHVAAAERAIRPNMQHLTAFTQAVRVAHRLKLGQAQEAEWQKALERLRSVQFGGIARMLTALPLAHAPAEGYSELTPAEREILQLLALGASTKEIAAKTARSPQTIDTHIRSICRKLRCSGRREAVALATGKGWVQGRTPG